MDLNGNGYGDILSGSYSRMEQPMAGLFQVLWGQPDGTFKKAAVLNGTDGRPLIIPIKGREEQTENINTRPMAVDWTGDGNLDLVVGNFAGTFYLFKGEGKGRFNPAPEPIMTVNGSRLKLQGNYGDPFPVDWNGNGALDLLSGSSGGGVQWAENVAGPGESPKLKPFRWLIEPGSKIEPGQLLREEELTGPVSATRIWVADVNADGKLDILVGDNVTLISPAEGVSEAEYVERRAQWQAEVNAASRTDPEKFRQIYERRSEFMNEQRTGYVWLYLGK